MSVTPATARAAFRTINAQPGLTATERGDIAEALGLLPYTGKETTKHGDCKPRPVIRPAAFPLTGPVEDMPEQPRGSARHRLQVVFSGRRIA